MKLNTEKTQMVDMLKGESFTFLGFDLRSVKNRAGSRYYISMTPKKEARLSVKSEIRTIIRRGGATPVKDLVAKLNDVVRGWVNYFRVGNSSRAFSEVPRLS